MVSLTDNYRQTDTDKQTQATIETHRQTDKQTDTGNHRDRQTDRHTNKHIHRQPVTYTVSCTFAVIDR